MKKKNVNRGSAKSAKVFKPNIMPVIMTGGRSIRMGSDKAFLPWGSITLLERLLREFSVCEVVSVTAAKGSFIKEYLEAIGYALSCKFYLDETCDEPFRTTFVLETSRAPSVPGDSICALKDLPREVCVIYDDAPGRGPIEGLRMVSQSLYGWFMAIAVDMPFVSAEFAVYLEQCCSDGIGAVVPVSNGVKNPLCALYDAEAILDAAQACVDKGTLKLSEFLEQVSANYPDISFSKFSDDVLQNANTPEEFENLRAPMPACFAVSGFKNSGKTTLAAKLIKKFSALGLKVGAVKHDGHDYEMDREGTDTQKLTDAGASASCIFSPNKWSINSSLPAKSSDLMISAASSAFELASGGDSVLDIVVVEGDKSGNLPKIVLVAELKNSSVLDAFGPNVICIAAEKGVPPLKKGKKNVKVCQRDDIDGIFDSLMSALAHNYPWLAAKKVFRPYLPSKWNNRR